MVYPSSVPSSISSSERGTCRRKYAMEHDVQLAEGYDHIFHDLEPFRGMELPESSEFKTKFDW